MSATTGVRLLKAVAVWAVVSGLLWLAAGPVTRLFLLPPVFALALKGLTWLALPITLGAAWRYPDLGDQAPSEDDA